MLQKIHHPHAVQFLGACTREQPYMIVTEASPILALCRPALLAIRQAAAMPTRTLTGCEACVHADALP